jgi:hypothetical protein
MKALVSLALGTIVTSTLTLWGTFLIGQNAYFWTDATNAFTFAALLIGAIYAGIYVAMWTRSWLED